MAENVNENVEVSPAALEEIMSTEEAMEYIQDAVRDAMQSQERYDGCANLSLPEPSIVHYYRSHAKRIIWLEDDINEDSIVIVNNIIAWNIEDAGKPIEDRKPIKIYINSPGGNLNECLAICDAIRMSETPVYTINLNMAASAAAAIFMCGHRRVAMPSAQFLIHLGSGGTMGTYQQTKSQQKNYEATIQTFKGILREQMKITSEQEDEFENLIDGEWYLYMTDTDESSVHNARKFNIVTEEIKSLALFNE